MTNDRAPVPKVKPAATTSRSTVAALVFIVVLAGVLYWGAQALVHHNAVQNCLDSGRRDCVPVGSAP